MTKSHFVIEKLCPVNPKKKDKSYTILALIIMAIRLLNVMIGIVFQRLFCLYQSNSASG